jgi:outer membrane protein
MRHPHLIIVCGNVAVITAGAACCLAGAGELPPLTLPEARETALRNHPSIRVSDLKALAARQATREVQSGFFPNLSANAVAVGTPESNTRLAAIGALNSPAIFDRNAEGLVLSQLITDFGRTANLTGSARLRAEAAANNAQATREQILLAVDGAFYSAQKAQAITRVAQQTVAAREVFLDQVSIYATNQLRSEMDVSFARVNVEDAELLSSKAQNDLQAAFAQLSTLMGLRESRSYRLVEQPLPPEVSTNVADFVQQALSRRPDLVSLRNQREAALKLARAEKEMRYPTVSAVGGAGLVPVHDSALSDDYAAAGVVISVPVFAGGYYRARQRAAELEAQADEANLRDLEDNVIRDVRIAWLDAQNAFDRYRISGQLLKNAQQSYDLAQARYKAGISSIVEFDQAALNLLSAQISLANTQYEYLTQRSILTFQIGGGVAGERREGH